MLVFLFNKQKESLEKGLENKLPEDFTYDNKVYSEDALEPTAESPVVGNNPGAPKIIIRGASSFSPEISSSPSPPEYVLQYQDPVLNSSRIPLSNMSENSSTHGNVCVYIQMLPLDADFHIASKIILINFSLLAPEWFPFTPSKLMQCFTIYTDTAYDHGMQNICMNNTQ